MNTEETNLPPVVLSTAQLCPAPSLRVAIFDWLCRKYVQRADARQKSLGLQYMEAETHDLAEGIAAQLEAELAVERERLAIFCENWTQRRDITADDIRKA